MPCSPWIPWMPCGPCGPVSPCGPVAPVSPVAPCGPYGPSGPAANIVEAPTAIALEAKIAITIPAINLPIVIETAAISARAQY